MIVKRTLPFSAISAVIIFLTFTVNANSSEKCDILNTEMDSQIVLRKEPDLSTPITAKITLADAQTISKIGISNDEKWLNVTLNNHSGWVSTQYIRCRHTPQAAKDIIADTARKVINAIKNNNWKELAAVTHPDKGVRFSTRPHINKMKDQVIKANKLYEAFYSPIKRVWGITKNNAKPITLSFADFTAEFLRQFKYWESTNIKYNELTDSIKHPNNVEKTYPNAIVAEFKVTGLDAKTHGSSSSTLCLVFEESEFEWRLVGIIYSR